jgi:hypothetical protein
MENIPSPIMAIEQREKYWELENLGQACLVSMTQLYKKVSCLGVKYQDKQYLTNKIDGFLKLISTATSCLQTNILSFQAKGACIVATRLVLSAVSMVIVHCVNSADVLMELYRERNVDLLQTNIMTLEIVEMMIENAVATDPNYLFFLPPEHDDWKMINKVFESNVKCIIHRARITLECSIRRRWKKTW